MKDKIILVLSVIVIALLIAISFLQEKTIRELRATILTSDLTLQDVLVLRDSLTEYKTKYNHAKDLYGFDVLINKTDSTWYVSTDGNTKADSAAVLLRYFSDRLEKTEDGWQINTTSYKEPYEDLLKSLKKNGLLKGDSVK